MFKQILYYIFDWKINKNGKLRKFRTKNMGYGDIESIENIINLSK